MAPFIVVIVVFHCPLGLCFVMIKLVCHVDCEKLGEAVDAPTYTDQMVEDANDVIFTFGSYRLGVSMLLLPFLDS